MPVSQMRALAVPTKPIPFEIPMSGLSKNAQSSYKNFLAKFCAYAGIRNEDMALAVLRDPLVLREFLGNLKDHKYGAQSIGVARAAVLYLAQTLVDGQRAEPALVANLKAIKSPKAAKHKKLGRWIKTEEVRALLLTAYNQPKNPARAARDTALIGFMVLTGLRRHEVAAIRWGDLGVTQGEHVLRTVRKGDKIAMVKIPDALMQLVLNWRKHAPSVADEEVMFFRLWRNDAVHMIRNPLTPKGIWNIVEGTARRAGLGVLSPHDLRRSFARGAYDAGVSIMLIQEALGHDSVATTERYIAAIKTYTNTAQDTFSEIIGAIV